MKHWTDELEGFSTCALRVDGPTMASSVSEAWEMLPASGTGWVCLFDRVTRFEPSRRTGNLLHAEVVDGQETTILRHEDGRWRAWTWIETEGSSHRVVRRRYLSSAPKVNDQIPEMEYATYWTLREDDGIEVWRPLGSRFVGWRES